MSATEGTQENRRHFTRIAMDYHAELTCSDQHWDAKVIDLSLKGALIQEPQDFEAPQSTQCTLLLSLDNSDISIEMEGEVVHHEKGHLGIRCDRIDLDSITHLKRVVELNLGSEQLLERELGELITPLE